MYFQIQSKELKAMRAELSSLRKEIHTQQSTSTEGGSQGAHGDEEQEESEANFNVRGMLHIRRVPRT